MTTSSKAIAVRVQRPPEVSLGEFFADLRTWLDHHCVMLADFRGDGDAFAALFDNPRDARLFERRFAAQSTSDVPGGIAARQPIRVSIPAAIAGAIRSFSAPVPPSNTNHLLGLGNMLGVVQKV